MRLEDWDNQLSSDNTDCQVKILEAQSWKAVSIDLKLVDILRSKMFTSGNIFQFEQMLWATPYAASTAASPCYNQENLSFKLGQVLKDLFYFWALYKGQPMLRY